MEGIKTVKGLIRKGDCLTKLDLKDAYLAVPMNPAHTPLEVPMVEPNTSVQYTSLWTLQSPLCIHKAPQASSSKSEKAGNQSCLLLGQHAYHGRLQRGSPSPSSDGNASLDGSGVYPQSRQECSDAHSGSDFLEVLPGFTYHGDLPTNSQDPVHTTADQRGSSPETDNNSQTIPAAGINDIHTSSGSTSPIVLLPIGESQDNSSETRSELQQGGDNLGQDEAGSNLVAPTTIQTQRQVYAGNSGTW